MEITIDWARLMAHTRWGNSTARGLAWHTSSGRCAVGYTDGEFRYAMGIGDTWREALANADERLARERR